MPFGPIPPLISIAVKIAKLTAVCMPCGRDAPYCQCLIDGRAAKFDDAIVMVGAKDVYQARCRDCFIIDKIHWAPAEPRLA